MPVHNGERFLRPAIESVLAQTMRDFELVCVEDGSSDGSPMILENFSSRDSRVRIMHLDGRGCSAARNVGMDVAQGEYIAFIDQDDLYHPRMLEWMVSAADTKDVDIVEASYVKVPESATVGSAFPGCAQPSVRVVPDSFGYFISEHKKRGGGIVCPVWNRMFRRSTVANIRFPEGVQPGEDSYFSYLAFDSHRPMAIVDGTLYAFRQNGGSTSHSTLSRIVDRFISGRERMLRFWANSASPRRDAFFACATRELAWIAKEARKRGDAATRRVVRERLSKLRGEQIFLLRNLPFSKRIKTWLFLKG